MSPLTLEYTLGPADFAAQQRAAQPGAVTRYRNQNFVVRTHWLIAGAAGLFASVRARIDAFAVGFLCLCAFHVLQMVMYKRQYRARVAASVAHLPPRRVRLVVDDAGFHEETEGIRSSAPWSAVRSVAVVDRTVVVQLNAGLWSVIPQAAFNGGEGAALAAFLAELGARGVPRRDA